MIPEDIPRKRVYSEEEVKELIKTVLIEVEDKVRNETTPDDAIDSCSPYCTDDYINGFQTAIENAWDDLHIAIFFIAEQYGIRLY